MGKRRAARNAARSGSTCIEVLVRKHYETEEGLPFDGDGLNEIIASSLTYLLKMCSSEDLGNTIKAAASPTTKTRDYCSELYQDGYILKNIKLWLWRTGQQVLTGAQCKASMSDFGVRAEDWPLAVAMSQNDDIRRELKHMRGTYESHTMSEWDAAVAQCLDNATGFFRNWAYTKLRWLENSGYITRDDLVSELAAAAYLGLLRQYPVLESEKHMHNLACMCARNGAANLNSWHDKPDRQFMSQNADSTFDNKFSSIEIEDDTQETVPEDADLEEWRAALAARGVPKSDTLADLCEATETPAMAELLSRYSGRKKRMLILLTGIEDQGFSEFLDTRGLPPNNVLFENIIDADRADQQGLLSRYVDLASDHLGVDRRKVRKFVSRLELQLAQFAKA